jgi:hypothetical protein
MCCAVQEAAVAKAVEEAGEVPGDATAALLITGLKRPFTPAALTQLLSETGIVTGEPSATPFLRALGWGVAETGIVTGGAAASLHSGSVNHMWA